MSGKFRRLADEEIEAIVREARVVGVLGMKDASRAIEPAYRIPLVLQDRGMRVIAINPKVLGSLPQVAALTERVDILDVFRRASNVDAHADEILAMSDALRPPVVWLQTGIVNEDAAERLAAHDIRVVMDECLGVWAARVRQRKVSV
ncbi:MAG TPA: CoA-binding protein [Candidatus Eisenbacteria bacterium]|nr:CoA-binding protein [Candidatus Eisenbacteria bacterium]